MKSKLIPGESLAAIDPQVVAYIERVGDDNEFPFTDKFLAIKNEVGRVYRVLIADGVGEAIEADQFLVGLGCVEEPTNRYNSLFQAPQSGV
ncbi:hypothetical protein LMG28614_05688 [Paraburkholderia ultramafica]|uniref:Uncharacterized protein n=1 Tax=Paraburkholderia ultramafica TaxID=1544867 RepID=A0A6S7C799_9BURK|nr:hypothetical protein [Paraburkholderia ultramafica]CAB3802749.1 hypothetical protein LMG28614_05688 [Paraburkholderia ultramafica]